ncbi:MAG TPA: hypothetical protein VF079_09215 [Sphingomicrobium sp.]
MLAGFAAVVTIAAIVKWRRRDTPMSVAEKAEYLSNRRARMLPALAVIFLSQQAAFLSTVNSPAPHSAYTVKISAWLVLSIVILAALATKGFWLEPKEVRDLIDDENTRSNRNDAMRWGFLFSMGGAIAVYALSLFDVTLTARDAVHIVMTIGIPAALIRWAALERRAHRDA